MCPICGHNIQEEAGECKIRHGFLTVEMAVEI